ncbi:MAG: hypothetical protein AB7F74_21480 [Parvibaculaceae bacterium]
MVLCLALLSACAGGGSKPFAKGAGTPGPSGKTVPPIALLEVSGMPAAKLAQLKDALATAAGKRDMAIIDSKLDNTTLTLTGRFTIAPGQSGARIGYGWTLTDPAGAVLHTISAEETAPGSPSGDPWLLVTPTVLQRIAAYTAESLSSRLSQLGYATELGGIPPPLETYARAGPDADKDIDYETLYGPGKGPTAVAEAQPPDGMAMASAPPPMDDKAALAAIEAQPADDKVVAAVAKPAKADAQGRKQISAVVVLPVSGAPGSGNADLTRAMRQTLSEAGWPVLSSPRENALTILGHVKLGPTQTKSQEVALAWTVKTPDGRTLGTVNQTNKVPTGSLEKGFGDDALFAAQAAATGIYDLVKKYR